MIKEETDAIIEKVRVLLGKINHHSVKDAEGEGCAAYKEHAIELAKVVTFQNIATQLEILNDHLSKLTAEKPQT
jgi:hypothetical protein